MTSDQSSSDAKVRYVYLVLGRLSISVSHVAGTLLFHKSTSMIQRGCINSGLIRGSNHSCPIPCYSTFLGSYRAGEGERNSCVHLTQTITVAKAKDQLPSQLSLILSTICRGSKLKRSYAHVQNKIAENDIHIA